MPASKKWTSKKENCEKVVDLYRQRDPLLTQQEIAEKLQTSVHNIRWAIQHYLTPDEQKVLYAMRYRKSKLGSQNPMSGKCGHLHHNFIGHCDDGYGYLTQMHNGKRQFVHRIVMAEALGLSEIPSDMVVHHIDGDPKNNQLDNLALVTITGHSVIHEMIKQLIRAEGYKASVLEEIIESLTLQLQKMKAT